MLLVVSLFYIWLAYLEYNDIHQKDTQDYLFFCNKSYEVHPILFWIKHACIRLVKQLLLRILLFQYVIYGLVAIYIMYKLEYIKINMYTLVTYSIQLCLPEKIGILLICLKEISYITYITYDYILY